MKGLVGGLGPGPPASPYLKSGRVATSQWLLGHFLEACKATVFEADYATFTEATLATCVGFLRYCLESLTRHVLHG